VSFSVTVPEAALTAPLELAPATVTVSVAASAAVALSMNAVPAAVATSNALTGRFVI
jgi:hypothetical protein